MPRITALALRRCDADPAEVAATAAAELARRNRQAAVLAGAAARCRGLVTG